MYETIATMWMCVTYAFSFIYQIYIKIHVEFVGKNSKQNHSLIIIYYLETRNGTQRFLVVVRTHSLYFYFFLISYACWFYWHCDCADQSVSLPFAAIICFPCFGGVSVCAMCLLCMHACTSSSNNNNNNKNNRKTNKIRSSISSTQNAISRNWLYIKFKKVKENMYNGRKSKNFVILLIFSCIQINCAYLVKGVIWLFFFFFASFLHLSWAGQPTPHSFIKMYVIDAFICIWRTLQSHSETKCTAHELHVSLGVENKCFFVIRLAVISAESEQKQKKK